MSRHRLEQLLALLAACWRELWWELEPVSHRRLRLYGLIDIINTRLSREIELEYEAGSFHPCPTSRVYPGRMVA